MLSNEFSEYYKTISNAELLSILDNPDDYQPMAIEAAKKEYTTRQLSEIQVNEAREILIVQKSQNEKKKEITKVFEQKAKANVNILIETLNPIQSGIPSTEKIIRFIVLVLTGLFLYELIKDFKMIRPTLEDIPRYPVESILSLLPFILLPLGIFTFWKRKSVGWTLIAIFLVFSAVATIWLLIQTLLWEPSTYSILDSLFPKPPVLSTIIQLLFFIGTLYAICKQNIRKIFRVSESEMIATLAITGALTFFIVYAYS